MGVVSSPASILRGRAEGCGGCRGGAGGARTLEPPHLPPSPPHGQQQGPYPNTGWTSHLAWMGPPTHPPPCAPLYPYHSRHCLLIKDHLMVCQTQRKWQVLINVQELPCATSHPVFSAFPWSPLPSPLPGPPDPASASVEANTKETSVRPGLTCSPPSGVPPQPFSPSPGSLSPGAGPSPSLTKGGHHERS